MLLLSALSPALVVLPLAIASPAVPHVDTLPTLVDEGLHYGRQDVQWTVGGYETDGQDHGFPRTPHHPHHPHGPVIVNKTIYQVLNDEPKFSKLFKLVNLNNATVELLNSTSSNITFFAPPDSAFPRPPKRRHPPNIRVMSTDPEDLFPKPEDPSDQVLDNILKEYELLDTFGSDDDDKKERRRKIIKYIVGAILSYHTIPQPFDAISLSQNSTYATNLSLPEGSLNGQPLRVRIGPAFLSPALAVNFFSRVIGPEIVTSNGILHLVSAPVLPPPAVFTGQFGAPATFSIATSALQRVGLTDELDYTYRPPHDGEKGRTVGSGTVTFFAPSNRAFTRLPIRLRLFLFSPFGQKALKKLLQYHIVPSHALHSDYIHNATSKSALSELNVTPAALPEQNMFVGTTREQFQGWVTSPPLAAQVQEIVTGHLEPNQGPPPPPLRNDQARAAPVPQPVPESGREGCSVRHTFDSPTPRRPFPPPPEVEYNVTVIVPTLLEGRTHTVVVTKLAPPKGLPGLPHPPVPGSSRTQLTVSGSRVSLADVPARNGAFHVIDHLLNPLKGRKQHEHPEFEDEWERLRYERLTEEQEWDDWEEWLPQWANEA